MRRSPWKVVISILALILVGCSQASSNAKPTTTPTPSLSLASGYVEGLSELAPNEIIFVLVKSGNTGTGSCNFPVVEQSPLAFWYSSGTLEISSSGSSGWLPDNHLIDVYQPEISGLGFFGYLTSDDYTLGGGIHDEIYTIDKLPYEVSSLSFVIHSILEDGTIIASVSGQAYQFNPEQSWKQTSSREYEGQPGCLITTTLSITNYGIMNSRNVKFVDDPILP